MEHGLRLAVILILAFLCVRILRTITNRLIFKSGEEGGNRASRMREQQTRTVAGVLYSAGITVVVIVAILMALQVFHFNIVPIAGAAGLSSLALGIGAQSFVRDIINGFFIVFEDQYVVGDLIRTGDFTGRVELLTIRRTVLRNAQGAIINIPNGQILQVANFSRDWSQVLLEITVSPDAPLEPALLALEQVATAFRADADWSTALVDGPRVLGVDALSPLGATLLLQVRTAPTRQDDVARELRRRISGDFERQRIRIASEYRIAVRYADEHGAPSAPFEAPPVPPQKEPQ
ncbi:MAG TPA: mechanosensitive ion channel family protein [Candidatus Acidoferrales bacterium]|nr:mechanosensitive ion channel family protein [Candidatus Acidoferrales bacterium]